jgi:hypothetical protein
MAFEVPKVVLTPEQRLRFQEAQAAASKVEAELLRGLRAGLKLTKTMEDFRETKQQIDGILREYK